VERLWPGAALECEAMKRPGHGARIGLLVLMGTGAGGWLAGSACGHGLEFLVARLELERDALRLEVTADWQDHPLLESEAGAQRVIRDLFEVAWKPGTEDGGGQDERGLACQPWTALADLHFEVRDQWDETAPLPIAPGFSERPHQLVCGIWRWQAPAGSLVQLRVPAGQALDTLLWQPSQKTEARGGEPRWAILITGDQSPWLGPFGSTPPVVPPRFRGVLDAAAVAGVVLVCLLLWVPLRRRFFRK